AGASLTVYAISRDASNNFVGDVLPDSWSLVNTSGGVGAPDLVTNLGTLSEFPIPTTSSRSSSIVAGPDGNLWFTEQSGNKVGRVTPAGIITEFSIPGSNPIGIAAGADGNLWFTEFGANKIGRITTGGLIAEFLIPTTSGLARNIAAGSDGNL